MQRKNLWVFALLAVVSCADNGKGVEADPAGSGAGSADSGGMQEDGLGAAGMVAPDPGEAATDTGDDQADDSSPSSADNPSSEPSGDEPMVDDSVGDDGQPADDSSSGPSDQSPDATPDDDADDSTSPMSDPSPAADPPADTTPAFTSLADLAPSPNNIPECPATAPENPWGPCVGVPVYAVCDYGTAPAPYYTCICDWIHWIGIGVQ